jgi:hypothetical protein
MTLAAAVLLCIAGLLLVLLTHGVLFIVGVVLLVLGVAGLLFGVFDNRRVV